MIANYHTHTARCGHARGKEREYIEYAIERGVKILGFSDHAPQYFTDDYESRIRMGTDALENYAQTVLALKTEYASDIAIHLGLEVEYYPAIFEVLVQHARDCGVEYFLLAQHYLGNEVGEKYTSVPREEPAFLKRYCQQVIEAMDTGMFTYLAHPDLVRDMGAPEVFEEEMRKLCRAANRNHLPVEINLLGVRDERHYPNEAFWRIAGEEGCQVVLGADAHAPEDVCEPEDVRKAMRLVEKYGLQLLETVELKNVAIL